MLGKFETKCEENQRDLKHSVPESSKQTCYKLLSLENGSFIEHHFNWNHFSVMKQDKKMYIFGLRARI